MMPASSFGVDWPGPELSDAETSDPGEETEGQKSGRDMLRLTQRNTATPTQRPTPKPIKMPPRRHATAGPATGSAIRLIALLALVSVDLHRVLNER